MRALAAVVLVVLAGCAAPPAPEVRVEMTAPRDTSSAADPLTLTARAVNAGAVPVESPCGLVFVVLDAERRLVSRPECQAPVRLAPGEDVRRAYQFAGERAPRRSGEYWLEARFEAPEFVEAAAFRVAWTSEFASGPTIGAWTEGGVPPEDAFSENVTVRTWFENREVRGLVVETGCPGVSFARNGRALVLGPHVACVPEPTPLDDGVVWSNATWNGTTYEDGAWRVAEPGTYRWSAVWRFTVEGVPGEKGMEGTVRWTG